MRIRVLSAAVLVAALLVPSATTASSGPAASDVRPREPGRLRGRRREARVAPVLRRPVRIVVRGSRRRERHRLHGHGRGRPRSVERRVPPRVPDGLRLVRLDRLLPDRGLRGDLTAVPDRRHRGDALHAARAQRRPLLPRAARRRERGPHPAAPKALASQRRARLGLHHPALQRGRPTGEGTSRRWAGPSTWRAAGSTPATTSSSWAPRRSPRASCCWRRATTRRSPTRRASRPRRATA